jgi:transcriptional regulator with XRE-family HTH domain
MKTHNPAEQLRQIRKSKGWSLQDVERYSNGKWKAVVIGSYERSDRAISLKKAISLLEFYQVPITELFPQSAEAVSASNFTLDLGKVKLEQNQSGEVLQKFAKMIANRRKDWNGQFLSLRNNDLQFLSLLLCLSQPETIEYLKTNQLVIS